MKADSEKIEWLLDNVTQYRIAKETTVNQSVLSRIKSGERKIENLSFTVASELTEYADRILASSREGTQSSSDDPKDVR